MKLSTGRIKLHAAMKTLKERWEQVKPGWNDVVCRAFEEDTLVPLEQQVGSVLRAVDALAQRLEEAQQEITSEDPI